MKKFGIGILSMCILLSLVSCAAQSQSQEAASDWAPMEAGAPASNSMVDDLAADSAYEHEERSTAFGGEAALFEPMVVRDANLTLVVEDPALSVQTIGDLAQELGGFIVVSNVHQRTYGNNQQTTTQASITIRVPVENLDQALEQIKDEAIEIRSENVRGEDVSQQFTDLQSRLRNLEAAESQLQNIMNSATETEDVLDIYAELRAVGEEIELIKGQMQYLQDSARLSAISIELIPDVLAQPLQIGGWRPEGTAKSALEALIQAFQVIADAAIWFSIFCLPILIVLGVPGFFIVRAGLRRRRMMRAKQNNPETPPEG